MYDMVLRARLASRDRRPLAMSLLTLASEDWAIRGQFSARELMVGCLHHSSPDGEGEAATGASSGVPGHRREKEM